MLKFQMGLIALLIGCVALISCGDLQKILMSGGDMPEEMMPEEMMPEEMMPEEMMPEEMMAAYTSWMSVTYPAFDSTHGQADRTVYINNVGAMALQAGMTTYPVGTMVVKEIMGSSDVLRMEKSDDPMHADTSGWLYNGMGSQAGCHGCHAKAGTDDKPGMDAVFTTDALMASLASMADVDEQ